jgi:hypothetical protein
MSISTSLEKLLTDPLVTRLTAVESNVTTVQARNLVDVGDNVSDLINDAGYQNAAQVNAIADTKINDLINSAPGTLDTLGEIATKLADEDSAIAALVAVNTTQSNAITAIEAVNTTQANQITTLLLRTGINRRTLSSDVTLTATDKRIQNCINPTATVRIVAFPASPAIDTDFIVKNHPTSLGNITVNGNTIAPSQIYAASYDGTEWMEY